MPLADREYMHPQEPPRRRPQRIRGQGISFNPVLVIIAVNLLIFVITLFWKDIIAYLGLIPLLAWEEPWRILTAMFLHNPYDFWHVFANMLMLFFFGRFLMMLVGEKKFLLVYFAGGIVGNLFAVFLSPANSLTIGASGAVYAVAAALAILVPKLRVNLYFIIPMPLWVVVFVFFVIFSFIPGVSWQGHIGGLLTGLAFGYYFRRKGGLHIFIQ